MLRRLHGGLDRGVTTDHHDDRGGILLAQLPERLEPVDPRHLHIHEDEMRLEARVLGEAVDGVRHGPHLVALELEQLAERGPNALLVVDDEDAAAHGATAPVVL